MKKNIYKYLAGNDYPGRGIVLGKSPDGQKAFVAYWIMGRSANSRNRAASARWPLTRPSSRTRTSSSTTLC